MSYRCVFVTNNLHSSNDLARRIGIVSQKKEVVKNIGISMAARNASMRLLSYR